MMQPVVTMAPNLNPAIRQNHLFLCWRCGRILAEYSDGQIVVRRNSPELFFEVQGALVLRCNLRQDRLARPCRADNYLTS